MNPEKERIRSLLVDTISLLCRNGLHFENELRVQAVVGVTVDKEDVFLVHINKCFERKTLDDEECENEEQLPVSKPLQEVEIAATAAEVEQLSSSQQLQPTRPAPTAPSEEGIKKPSASQDLSPSGEKLNNSQQQLPVTDSNASKSNVQSAKPLRHESLDDCEDLIADSDDCDDGSVFMPEMQQQRYYNSSQPTRNKPRSSFDAYRPKTKRQYLNDDLFDDYCSEFNVGQQYMYIDSGRSRARPKVSRQQQPTRNKPFDPQCTPSMLAYGSQDVRLLALTS